MKQAERYLTDGLHRLAGEMPAAHVDFETVRRQAGHSPARTVVLAVAAAAAAIALPIGAIYFLTQPNGKPQPAATTSTATGLPSPKGDFAPPAGSTPTPERTVAFNPTDLTTGAPPALPYYGDGKIYSADGRVEVAVKVPPNGTVSRFARYGDGWVVMVQDEDLITETRIYDATGNLRQAFTTSALSLARGQDGSVAVSMKSGEVTLVDAAGDEVHTWVIPAYRVSPVAVLPDDSVVVTASTSGRPVTLRALPDGSLQAMSYDTAYSVNPSSLDVTIGHICLAALTTDPQRPLWQICPYLGDGVFSPDGRYVLARALQGVSKQGGVRTKLNASIGILDARTGALLVRFDPRPQPYIASLAWEDDTHALVMVYSMPTWHALRVGVDGSVELVDTADLAAHYMDTPQFEGSE